ncbi:hypothetical protein NL676_005733 [Syzygium grande]|nr:hypothetical protein NL676_005733 [Syzygium grande]
MDLVRGPSVLSSHRLRYGRSAPNVSPAGGHSKPNRARVRSQEFLGSATGGTQGGECREEQQQQVASVQRWH